MRWNVVIGGQFFTKSFLGYTTYKMTLVTREGLLVADRVHTLAVGLSCGYWSSCCRRGLNEHMAPEGCRQRDLEVSIDRRVDATDRVKTMNVLPEALETLTSRVDALEKRVHDLEHPSEALAPFH